jgi:hypothetical protein
MERRKRKKTKTRGRERDGEKYNVQEIVGADDRVN